VDNEDLGAIAAAVEIDDDDEPAPMNRPDHDNLPPDIFKEWGPVNFCHRKRENFRNTSPKISFPQNTAPSMVPCYSFAYLALAVCTTTVCVVLRGSCYS
jgi:hypothetical protein